MSHRSMAVILLALTVAGCAAQTSRVRVDAIEGQLPACSTFAWHAAASGDAASFNDQRVRNAVMQTLKAKGYEEAPEKADCRIAYQLNSQRVEPQKPRVGVGVGGGSRGVGGGIGVSLPIGKRAGERGTFTLDVIDAAKNAQVWSGSVDASLAAAEISDEEAREIVEEILAKYPDRAR